MNTKINIKHFTGLILSSSVLIASTASAHGYEVHSRNALCKYDSSRSLYKDLNFPEVEKNKECGQVQWEPQSLEGLKLFPFNKDSSDPFNPGSPPETLPHTAPISSIARTGIEESNQWIGEDDNQELRWNIIDWSNTDWEDNKAEKSFYWYFTAAHPTLGFRYYITPVGWEGENLLSDETTEIGTVNFNTFKEVLDTNNPVYIQPEPFCQFGDYEKGNIVNSPGDIESVDRDESIKVDGTPMIKHVCKEVPKRTGYHMILAVWDIGDTVNAFYNVIDVNFGDDAPQEPEAVINLNSSESTVSISNPEDGYNINNPLITLGDGNLVLTADSNPNWQYSWKVGDDTFDGSTLTLFIGEKDDKPSNIEISLEVSSKDGDFDTDTSNFYVQSYADFLPDLVLQINDVHAVNPTLEPILNGIEDPELYNYEWSLSSDDTLFNENFYEITNGDTSKPIIEFKDFPYNIEFNLEVTVSDVDNPVLKKEQKDLAKFETGFKRVGYKNVTDNENLKEGDYVYIEEISTMGVYDLKDNPSMYVLDQDYAWNEWPIVYAKYINQLSNYHISIAFIETNENRNKLVEQPLKTSNSIEFIIRTSDFDVGQADLIIHKDHDIDEYTPGVPYEFGELVRYEGEVYLCLIPSWCAIDAFNPGVSSDAWLLIENDTSGDTYVPGQDYEAGDTVINLGVTYRCVVAGWCGGSPTHYAPGVGLSWMSAWEETSETCSHSHH
jgi:predicted carbohydrate-binding protein with CBM5 and CBM33 domain